jgi:hypothetical protein
MLLNPILRLFYFIRKIITKTNLIKNMVTELYLGFELASQQFTKISEFKKYN